MVGEENTKFAPEHTMTRAMAVTVLYRMAGAPEVTGKADFTDIRQDYYTDALIWGTQNGIVAGYGNGKFGPNDAVSRQEFAAFVYRFLNNQKITVEDGTAITFTDADTIADYAKPAVETCTKAGIIHGCGDGTFQPMRSITREEAATMLTLLMKLL